MSVALQKQIFTSTDSAKVVIGNDGSVGIGTINPAGKLDVAGGYEYRDTGAITRNASAPRCPCDKSDSVRDCPSFIVSNSDLGSSCYDQYRPNLAGPLPVPVSSVRYDKAGTPSMMVVKEGYVKARSGLCIADDCKTSWASRTKVCGPLPGDGNCRSESIFNEGKFYLLQLTRLTPDPDDGEQYNTWISLMKSSIDTDAKKLIKFSSVAGYAWRVNIFPALGRLQRYDTATSTWVNVGSGWTWTLWELNWL